MKTRIEIVDFIKRNGEFSHRRIKINDVECDELPNDVEILSSATIFYIKDFTEN